LLNISYTDLEPLTYVGLSFVGPGQTQMGELSIHDSGADYTWSWPVTVDTPGRYTIMFIYDQPQKTGSSCEFDVANTGRRSGLREQYGNLLRAAAHHRLRRGLPVVL
jgi:hypothetical protein